MDPRAITELFPNWKELGAPLNQPVTGDDLLVLSETGATRTPDWLIPRNFDNHGGYVISLGALTKWLGEQAEALGVEIFPGFSAAEVLYNKDGSVKGVATWASNSSRSSSWAKARTRRPLRSASRSCGKCRPTKPSPAWWCTPLAGR